jgi:hypothetical protein
MKKLACFLCLLLVTSLACSLVAVAPSSQPSTNEPAVVVTDTFIAPPTAPATPDAPAFNGVEVKLNDIAFVIPIGLAAGATENQVEPQTDQNGPYWELTPGNSEVVINGYVLQNKFHEPRIYVYPAQGFAALNEGAAESIRRLQILLANPATPLTDDMLPYVPFFNAGAVFTAQTQVLQFKNGVGVRMVTQYAQSFAQVNNHETFYHFQGLTSDGQYYIIAILPITAPILAENNDGTAPSEGVPFPGYSDPNADFQGYYDQVVVKLNSLSPDAFSPTITNLDNLIASIQLFP